MSYSIFMIKVWMIGYCRQQNDLKRIIVKEFQIHNYFQNWLTLSIISLLKTIYQIIKLIMLFQQGLELNNIVPLQLFAALENKLIKNFKIIAEKIQSNQLFKNQVDRLQNQSIAFKSKINNLESIVNKLESNLNIRHLQQKINTVFLSHQNMIEEFNIFKPAFEQARDHSQVLIKINTGIESNQNQIKKQIVSVSAKHALLLEHHKLAMNKKFQSIQKERQHLQQSIRTYKQEIKQLINKIEDFKTKINIPQINGNQANKIWIQHIKLMKEKFYGQIIHRDELLQLKQNIKILQKNIQQKIDEEQYTHIIEVLTDQIKKIINTNTFTETQTNTSGMMLSLNHSQFNLTPRNNDINLFKSPELLQNSKLNQHIPFNITHRRRFKSNTKQDQVKIQSLKLRLELLENDIIKIKKDLIQSKKQRIDLQTEIKISNAMKDSQKNINQIKPKEQKLKDNNRGLKLYSSSEKMNEELIIFPLIKKERYKIQNDNQISMNVQEHSQEILSIKKSNKNINQGEISFKRYQSNEKINQNVNTHLMKQFEKKMSDFRTETHYYYKQLEKLINTKQNKEQNRKKYDELILLIEEIKKISNKKADIQTNKKSFLFLENKINQIISIMIASETQAENFINKRAMIGHGYEKQKNTNPKLNPQIPSRVAGFSGIQKNHEKLKEQKKQ